MTLQSTKSSAKTVLTSSPINTQKVIVPDKITATNRHSQIEKEAYYLAENENFKGDSVAHWLQAEASIDTKLAVK